MSLVSCGLLLINFIIRKPFAYYSIIKFNNIDNMREKSSKRDNLNLVLKSVGLPRWWTFFSFIFLFHILKKRQGDISTSDFLLIAVALELEFLRPRNGAHDHENQPSETANLSGSASQRNDWHCGSDFKIHPQSFPTMLFRQHWALKSLSSDHWRQGNQNSRILPDAKC